MELGDWCTSGKMGVGWVGIPKVSLRFKVTNHPSLSETGLPGIWDILCWNQKNARPTGTS